MNRTAEADEFTGGPVPPRLSEPPPHFLPRLALFMLAAAGTAAILFLFNPVEHSFYPVCYFHAATGLQCPGCGSLRAMHQLLHGHLFEAARLNLLLILCLPYLGWCSIQFAISRRRGLQTTFAIRSVWLWMFFFAAVVFTVLRNLPFPAFAWMRP